MKYVDEFRNKKLIQRCADRIKQIMPNHPVNIMEVCGTHTQNFHRFGLKKLLPQNLRLISGPGCPVCVSAESYIDSAIQLARRPDTIILTFGDMLRIPGAKSSLEKEKAALGNIFVVYSPLDSLRIARRNPDKEVIFLAVGFETTAPAFALAIAEAKKEKLKNLSFFCALKLIPPAMHYLVGEKRLRLDGFLCPGHVSAVIGTKPYEAIVKKYRIPCCVAGFEPLDILEGIYLLLRQINKQKPRVENQYERVVSRAGNLKAQKLISGVFQITNAYWRSLGVIPKSGLKIRDEFSHFAAEKFLPSHRFTNYEPRVTSHEQRSTKCRCKDVLKGLISPKQCPLFAKACTIDHPVGPCMVTNEGACNAYYKYRE